MPERLPAPVQGERGRGSVSREIAEMAYLDYRRRYGDDQSLDRLLERGGFSWGELVFHLYSELVKRHGSEVESHKVRFEDHVRVDPSR